MDADVLTTKSTEALQSAVQRAATAGHPDVRPAHLLAALLEQADGATVPLLRAAGVDAEAVRAGVDRLLGRLPRATGAGVAAPGLARSLHAVLTGAEKSARERGDEYVSTEHLVVALAAGEGEVGDLLRSAGGTSEALTEAFAVLRGGRRVTSRDPEATYQALEKFGVDLTERAREGGLDPVVGRDSEIRRVVQVLSRRTKNNPVLIGEPGRRQDRGGGGPGPAHRPPATCRRACGTGASCPWTWARWSRARSTGGSSRSG